MLTRVVSVVAAISGLAAALTSAKGYAAVIPHTPHQAQYADKTIEGTVEAVARGEMRVVAGRNQREWLVVFQPLTKVLVKAKAEVSYLKAGQTVEFYAELDAEDVAKEKLAELSVVTLRAEDKSGIFPPDSKPVNAADPQGDKQRGKHGRKRGVLTHVGSRVVGRSTSRKDNKLTVQADKRKVQIELSDLPVINVSLPDATLIVPGSSVVVHGKAVPGKPLCQADDVQVTSSRILKGKGKRTAAKKPLDTAKPPAKAGPESEEAEEPDKGESPSPEAADDLTGS
jgi:hypothetical protein